MIEYLESEKYLTKDNTFSYEILNSDEYRGWSMIYKDGKILYNLCKELKPKTTLEIGTYHGFSSAYLLSAIKDNNYGFLYSVDPRIKHIKIAYEHLKNISEDFELMEAFSAYIPSKYISCDYAVELTWDKSIDFLFVDGDHSTKSALSDLTKYEPYVNKGGLILCHDYMMPEVQPTVDGYFKSRMDQYYIKILNNDQFHNHLYIAYKK